ncbi:MAG: hypothetical protein DMF96_08340 [Acidobacteria bacterium]|nr:MAG: hypothetical protein DMF96_08340 [Acidobacteriota bacterium]
MNVTIKGLTLAALCSFGLAAQQPTPATPFIHAKAARRLVIRNAMVIYGNAKPPYGPVDIVVEDGLISYIGPDDGPGSSAAGRTSQRSSDSVIDATGKYVMPGIVNAHMHWSTGRSAGRPRAMRTRSSLRASWSIRSSARDAPDRRPRSARGSATSGRRAPTA